MAIALSLVAATGCGDDQPSGSDTQAVDIEIRDPAEDKVAMTAPAEVDAGLVRITLTNRGDTRHDAQLVRVDGRRTADDVIFDVLEKVDNYPKPKWFHPAGGLGMVPPGENATVTQVLEPGTYFIADTQERATGAIGKSTNAVNGGVAKLTVTGDRGGEKLPATRAHIVATDKGFDAWGIRPGRNRVTFVNESDEIHQVVVFPVPKGEPLQRAAQALYDKQVDVGWVPVPFHHSRATAVLDAGERQVVDLTFKRGRYLLTCFVSDRAGGLSHLAQSEIVAMTVPTKKTR